jgi:hypothetical protein
VVVTGTERDGSADCLFAFEANTGTKLYGKRFCARRINIQNTGDAPIAFVEAAWKGTNGKWRYRVHEFKVRKSGLDLIRSFCFADDDHLQEYAAQSTGRQCKILPSKATHKGTRQM